MSRIKRLIQAVVVLWAVSSWAQPNVLNPDIGYIYPAGGQQGTVVEISVGGQLLRGVSGIRVTGDGVQARIVKHYPFFRNLDREQRDAVRIQLTRLWIEKLDEEMPGASRRLWGRDRERSMMALLPPGASRRGLDASKSSMVTVEHPLFNDLEHKSLRELEHVVYHLRFPRWKRQLNTQIGETVLVEIDIDADAAPGGRELRLVTPLGLTNPMVFEVGRLPELVELEPNDPGADSRLPDPPPLDLPVLLNGQILPGDVDRFSFRAQRGQKLVLETHARRLIPYLADAVPGWFQAFLGLYDAAGNELAFDDDFRFDPDPVLFFEVPESGIYHLEVRDAIYRGREDFVYRIAVGEQPFVTSSFPLGGRSGETTVAAVEGWNLVTDTMRLDTRPGADGIQRAVLYQGGHPSNVLSYAIDRLPELEEREPNDDAANAQVVELPQIVNGRIERPGDVDVFLVNGRAGDELVAEVYGRRLQSPLDSVLRLIDSEGGVLAWNDDHEDPASGLSTHHADSYLRLRLPHDGRYRVQLAEAQQHGGASFAYRLRIGLPQPDFELRVTPSGINLPARGAAPLTVYALRRDGFDGDIELSLENAPPGFELHGARIPAGSDSVRMTLTAGWRELAEPVVLQLEGRARIGGRTLVRRAVPADDMMQAFIYRHLVPSRELVAAVRRRPPGLPATIAQSGPVRIPAGGRVEVLAKMPRHPKLREVSYELVDPPEGVTLRDASLGSRGLELELAADRDAVERGYEDNLIVEAYFMQEGRRDGGGGQRSRRVSLGMLPAIPFEIVSN
jgi:hypothetical protein